MRPRVDVLATAAAYSMVALVTLGQCAQGVPAAEGFRPRPLPTPRARVAKPTPLPVPPRPTWICSVSGTQKFLRQCDPRPPVMKTIQAGPPERTTAQADATDTPCQAAQRAYDAATREAVNASLACVGVPTAAFAGCMARSGEAGTRQTAAGIAQDKACKP